MADADPWTPGDSMNSRRHLRLVPERPSEALRAQLTFGALSAADRGADAEPVRPGLDVETAERFTTIRQRLLEQGGLG